MLAFNLANLKKWLVILNDYIGMVDSVTGWIIVTFRAIQEALAIGLLPHIICHYEALWGRGSQLQVGMVVTNGPGTQPLQVHWMQTHDWPEAKQLNTKHSRSHRITLAMTKFIFPSLHLRCCISQIPRCNHIAILYFPTFPALLV